jgi:branched-chain amino acid transport system permease protein
LRNLQGDVLAIPGRFMALVFVLLLLFLPLATKDPYILRILIFANIYVIFAVSWDLISGYTGQISFGHALFFGVAAYAAALLNLHLGLEPWATIPIGGLAAAIAGLVVCLPALRLRGPYLSLVTLALPLILLGVVFYFSDFTGGELGISGIARIYGSRTVQYYISLTMMLASVLIMWKLTDAKSRIVRTGIILHAIREDEIAARASGINTVRYKLMAFAVGGFFAGLAGGYYAHFMRIAGPSTLDLFLSFQVIIWAVFGGICTIYGAVVGVYILYPLVWEFLLTDFLDVSSEVRLLTFASVVVLVLLFMPEGIAVWVRDKIERTCPRCKLANAAFRPTCRACSAPLRTGRR